MEYKYGKYKWRRRRKKINFITEDYLIIVLKFLELNCYSILCSKSRALFQILYEFENMHSFKASTMIASALYREALVLRSSHK